MHALQQFDPAGRAIGKSDLLSPASKSTLRHLALGNSGERWSVGAFEYTLTHWDTTGRPTTRFTGAFPTSSTAPVTSEVDYAERRPPSQVNGLRIDHSGLLWVFIVVPRDDIDLASADPSRVYQTFIEVIDPTKGKILSKAKVDKMVFPLGRDHAYAVIETPDGDHRVQVYKTVLQR